MGWQDSFGFLEDSLRRSPFGPTGYLTPLERAQPRTSFGARSRRGAWSELASGRLAGRAVGDPVTRPAGAPERFEFSLPYSSTAERSPYQPTPSAPPRSTEGDLLGSIGGSIGDLIGNQGINLGNFVPFLMERLNVVSGQLADSDIPVVSDAAKAAHPATQAFIDGVEAVMRPVGQVFDAFPTWVRDSQLGDRAKLYRAIAKGSGTDYGIGPVSNPISTLGQLASLVVSPTGMAQRAVSGDSQNMYGWLTGETVSDQAAQAKHWHDVLTQAIDPKGRMDAERRLAILKETIDLPESLKLALDADPDLSDEQLTKLLDEAPEGRQWSYAPGVSGLVQNIGNPNLILGAEWMGTLGVAGRLGAFAETAGSATGAGLIPSAGRLAASGINAAGRGISAAAKLQTAAVGTGIGLTSANVVMGAIARYVGADEAIDWFDQANRSTEFSDDPYVQISTGFAVNPFEATRMARNGIVRLKHGLVDVPVNRALARRLATYYDSRAVIEDMTRRMFKLGSREEAAAFLDEHGLRDTAADRILGTALDVVLDKVPSKERMAWNAMHTDPVERAGATLKRWGRQALDLIEKDPDLVAARFHDYDWNYRMMPGPFSAEAAAKIARDHRSAVEMTYDLRAQQRLVVGYREYLPPAGQALARERIAEAVDADGMIPMRTLQELVVDFPALRKEWGGLVQSGDERIPRDVLESIVDKASATWAAAAKRNPVRTETGFDPVIRPSSPTRIADYADALGTDAETFQAFEHFDPKSSGKVDLLRRFLVDKAEVDEATAQTLSPEDVFGRASDYIDRVATPWHEAGRRIETAEVQMSRLRGELARLRREGGPTEADRTVRLQRQIDELADLVRRAGDPIHTYASQTPITTGRGDIRLAELASRKVDAIERLKTLTRVDEDLKTAGLTTADLTRVVRGGDGELADVFQLHGAPPKPILDAFLNYRTASMYVNRNLPGELTRRRQVVRELSNKGAQYVSDIEAAPGSYQWAEIAKSPGFLRTLRQRADNLVTYGDHELTGNEVADIVEAVGLTRGMSGKPLDEIAEAWGTDRAGALERLAELKASHAGALDGSRPSSIQRTANIKVGDDYVRQAEADRAARDLVYDAEYDAFWHPRNVAKVLDITSNPDELYGGLRAVVDGDAALEEGIVKVATRAGVSPDDVLADPAYAAEVRRELVPADFEPPIEGQIRPWTDLDNLIVAGDAAKIAALSERLAIARAEPRPPIQVSEKVARALSAMPRQRRSYQYRRQLTAADADLAAAPSERILAAKSNRLGLDVLSVMNHGIPGTKPATIQGTVALLRDIENGAAGRMGLGPELQAEAQRVARAILDDAVHQARRDPNVAGTFGAGFFPEDEQALSATLERMLSFDEADPLGTLQYGLKQAPKDAVVMEWSKVPGLAEELLSGRFQPWSERVWTTKTKQAVNWVFGPRSNETIRAETRNRFVERAGRHGVSQLVAGRIWDRWERIAHDSRRPSLRRTPTGRRTYEAGDSETGYANMWNVPNEVLDSAVHGSHAGPGVLAELASDPKVAISAAEMKAAETVDWAKVFRESASFTRRTLKDRVPLGELLADTYGLAAHNKAVTTLYYWFRFGLDIRYHAMNYLEAQILYAGRAGLRKGEIDTGLLGQTEAALRKLESDPTSNTGYTFSRDRMAWAYRTFLKEQPDALRSGIRSIVKDGPEGQALMEQAMGELASSDPQLRDMLRAMQATPEKYLRELDAWHSKMLANVDEAADGATIDQALASEMAATPALAAVYDRLGQVNRDLWADVRKTFYGNPNRSRAERVLNSYLLFWPLSYQIKSTKWFLRVLFDRAGGLPTNAAPAVVLDRIADTHNRLLATDPLYRDWFEKHRTLVFVAQMLFPVSFDSMGVSLNPALRGLFFDRGPMRALEIGPVYTYNRVIRPLAKELEVDVFPSVRDTLTGRDP